MQIEAKRLEWLEGIELDKGSHPSRTAGVCVMEAVAYVAGEEHSDTPECVCPVLGAFMRRWNDDLDAAGRQRLKPYVTRLVGTKATPEIADARAWLATDWMVRVHAPAWLELGGMREQAEALRALPEITGASVGHAQPALNSAREDAAAAWDAASDAARAAARAAAWAAARAAASDAARDAARAAASDAASDAARAAASDAARAAASDAARAAAVAKLEPTKIGLQDSAFDLLDRMLALGSGGGGDAIQTDTV